MEVLHRIDCEITNRCNAGCPLCPRTGDYKGGVSEVIHRMGYRDIEIDTIQNILDSKSAQNLKHFSYCGNYGDPFMHPKILDILNLVSSYGITQRLDTNGGMRTPKFWSEVGKIPGIKINFAIDGLEDTNHIYRVKTQWHKIMANAEAYIKSGGHADWIMIIFSHNEHQIEEANKLSKKIGFKEFQTKISTRGLNLSDQKRYQPALKDIKVPKNKKYQPPEMIEGYVEKPVSCAAIYQEQFFLTPDNMILPCCYVHSELTKNTYNISTKANEFYNFLIDNNVKYDLDKFDFDEVVDSYRSNLNILKDYWLKRLIPICNRICGSNKKNKVKVYNEIQNSTR